MLEASPNVSKESFSFNASQKEGLEVSEVPVGDAHPLKFGADVQQD